MRKPTAEELRQAVNGTVPDVIAQGLKVLFCGINPSVYSAVVGHHFARPGNRFWPVLHAAGITPHRFSPDEDATLVDLGYGITNVVDRATVAAADLAPEELVAGGAQLAAKVRHYRPRVLAILGVTAYRAAFGRPKATLGRQEECIGETQVWVLPNPSGLNAHYQVADLANRFRLVNAAAESA